MTTRNVRRLAGGDRFAARRAPADKANDVLSQSQRLLLLAADYYLR
jgi:hypothetical protein